MFMLSHDTRDKSPWVSIVEPVCWYDELINPYPWIISPLGLFPPLFRAIWKQGGNNWGAPPPEKFFGAFDEFSLEFLVFRTHKHSFGNRKCVLTSADPQNFPPAAGYGVYKYSSDVYFSPPQAEIFWILAAHPNYFPPCYGRFQNKGGIIQGYRLITRQSSSVKHHMVLVDGRTFG